MSTTICPGCGDQKTRRARLCASCYRRAVSVGVQALLESAERGSRPAVEMISPRQRSAIYARTDELDRLLERPYRHGHDVVLQQASVQFSRTIKSVNELSYDEASWVLDQLALELAAAKSVLLT